LRSSASGVVSSLLLAAASMARDRNAVCVIAQASSCVTVCGLALTSGVHMRLPAAPEPSRFSRGRPSSGGCLERAVTQEATKTPRLRRE
jgi:hypothetical protein